MLPGVLILLSVMISVTALYIGMTAFPDGMKAKCYTRLFRNQTGKLYSAFPLVLHILTVRGSIADMLPLGKVGKGFETGERDCLFTREEQKTMMTLWCMFRSPLMIGAELTKMDDFTLSLLTNKELSGREPDKDSYEFTELWSGEVLHSGKEALTVVVPAHGTKVFSVR
jgi:hypothetical protein